MGLFPSVPSPSLNYTKRCSFLVPNETDISQLLRASTAYLYIPFKTWKINMFLKISSKYIVHPQLLVHHKFARTNSHLPLSPVNV